LGLLRGSCLHGTIKSNGLHKTIARFPIMSGYPWFPYHDSDVPRHADYHLAASGLGAAGFKLEDPELAEDVLRKAKEKAREGQPVVVNAILGKSDFRKGSISM